MAHQRKGNKIAVVYSHDCEGIEELADYPIQIKIGQDMEERSAGSGLHPVCSDHRSDVVSVSGHYPDDTAEQGRRGVGVSPCIRTR